MLSDVLFDAIHEIEDYQRRYPDIYDGHKDHVESVKKVMESLQGILDECPGSFPPPSNVADTLSDHQKVWFQATCEAQIARWAECLRLLGPVTGEELVKKLDDAIQRQDAMLKGRSILAGGVERADVQPYPATFVQAESVANGKAIEPDKSEAGPTKKVYVSLIATETIGQKTVLVVEVPADCDESEIQEMSALSLCSDAEELGYNPYWEETGKSYGCQLTDEIRVESGVSDDEEADLVLERDEDGELVSTLELADEDDDEDDEDDQEDD